MCIHYVSAICALALYVMNGYLHSYDDPKLKVFVKSRYVGPNHVLELSSLTLLQKTSLLSEWPALIFDHYPSIYCTGIRAPRGVGRSFRLPLVDGDESSNKLGFYGHYVIACFHC